jgi:hypothetical protein
MDARIKSGHDGGFVVQFNFQTAKPSLRAQRSNPWPRKERKNGLLRSQSRPWNVEWAKARLRRAHHFLPRKMVGTLRFAHPTAAPPLSRAPIQFSNSQTVIASGAKQSILPRKERWIASLRSQ